MHLPCILSSPPIELGRVMVFSEYTKQRILSMEWQEYKVSAIVECLVLQDRIRVSKQGVRQFLLRYRHTGTIARKTGSGPCAILSPVIRQIIEETLLEDDETTATQRQAKL